MVCTHCAGYGSSLKESADTCTKCHGSGVVCDGCGVAVPLSFSTLNDPTLCEACKKKAVQVINITL